MLTIKALQKLLRREQTPLVSSHIVSLSLSLSLNKTPLSSKAEQNQEMRTATMTIKALQKCTENMTWKFGPE